MERQLLLISNSTQYGGGYLDHCFDAVREFLGDARRLLFVPFALADRRGYTRTVAARLAEIEVEVTGWSDGAAARRQLQEAEAVFVGGGNTFRLLATVQRAGLLDPLRERVLAGLRYMGASAGSNLACPTLRTTNDMPIVEPESFHALGLVPFQINPHYLDPDPSSRHMGETREQRLREYLEENRLPVVGLREGAWIRVEAERATLGGARGARILRRDREPEEREAGADLSDLL